MSSLVSNRIPPPFLFLSSLMGPLKPSSKNFSLGKVLSNFVSEIIIISKFPLIVSTSKSKLFLRKFILKCTIINLLNNAWKVSKYKVFFWSVFSLIRVEYEKILRISTHLVRMRENMDQKKLCISILFTQYKLSLWKIQF